MKTIFRSGLVLSGITAAFAWTMATPGPAAEPNKSAEPVYEAGCDPAFAASYPLYPKLMEIPANQPKILMEYPFRGTKTFAELRCRYTATAGEKIVTKETLLSTAGQFWIDLSGMPLGKGRVIVEILDKADFSVINAMDYAYQIISPEQVYPFEGKELNSLVSELVNRKLDKNDSTKEALNQLKFASVNQAEFNNFREGWVYMAVIGKDKVPAATLTLDGKELKLERNEKANSMEAFRKLPAGHYTIRAAGDTTDASLIVRSVPMLFSYPLCRNSAIEGNPPYDYEFHKKYIFPANTTFTGGPLAEEHHAEFRASGRELFSNIGGLIKFFMAGDQKVLKQEITDHPQVQEAIYTGVTIDELFMFPGEYKALDALSIYLKDVKYTDNKPVYTWIVGNPPGRGICARAISAMVNATEGRGMMLLESYNAPQSDKEAEAKAILQRDIIETMQSYSRSWSGADSYLAVVFGNFTQGPTYRVDSHPAVDYKYFLDMQFHLLANSPEMHHVPGVGYWGSYYADEENLRWSFALMRHYGVEGKKDMLSDQYGFHYFLPYVTNPDFTDQLKGWTVQAASEGKIESYKNDKLASWQSRWQSSHPYAALMTRSAKGPNVLSQKIQKLVPGKLYTFQVFALDPNGERTAPQDVQFRADISGVEIIKAYRFAAKNNNFGQYTIFRAQSDSATITLSDWQDDKTACGPAGQQTAFNFVKVTPYFSADEKENLKK